MSIKMKDHSKVNVTKTKLKFECHSKWNDIYNGISLKMEFHSKCNFTQNGMSPKMECHSKTDFKFIGKVEFQTNNFFKSSVLAHFT